MCSLLPTLHRARSGVAVVMFTMLLASWTSAPAPASASGPVERLLQLLAHPTDPNLLVVRYGAATQGFLFSRDGGRSFRAMCSTFVAPELKGSDRITRISLRQVPSTAAVLLDAQGRLLFSQYGSLWSDDGTGCSWSKLPEFNGKWAYSIKPDPSSPGVVWAAVTTAVASAAGMQSQAELMRRDAAGTWSVAGRMLELAVGQVIMDGDLLVFADGSRTRLYGAIKVFGGPQGNRKVVVVSDDLGATWTAHELSLEQQDLTLLAADPSDSNRLIAVIPRDGAADSVLLSQNGGASFEPYATLYGASGVTFDAKGRAFVAVLGDGSGEDAAGGLYTAAKLGDSLMKVPGTQGFECVHYQAQTSKLYACSRDRFGTVDPLTGAFEELIRLERVEGLIECPGADLLAACEAQLNSGPAWCCAGHYPFTPFCGEYDVTRTDDGRNVFCGLAGREYDRPATSKDAGASAEAGDGGDPADAGVRPDGGPGDQDGGDPITPVRLNRDSDGCALASGNASTSAGGALVAFLSAMFALAHRRRRLGSSRHAQR